MFLCHLNEQNKNCVQGNNIIIEVKEASCAFQVFNVIIVSISSDVLFLLEDFLYGEVFLRVIMYE